MTFAEGAGVPGAIDNAIVEIDLPKCLHTYGSSPCTAAAGAGNECWNSRATCQDLANYDASGNLLTLRLSMADRGALWGVQAYPIIERLDIARTKLNPANGLSSRERLDITVIDVQDGDTLTDPYIASRPYDADSQGTLFGKLLARFPYMAGKAIRVKMGYAPLDGSAPTLADYDKTYNYLIESIEGPDNRGRVKIVAKDPLALTEKLKAEIPRTSTGTLSAAVTDVQTTLPLQAGEGADYVDTSGNKIVRLGDELILLNGRTGDTLNVTTRGYLGTEASAHDSGDSVQLCYEVGYLNTTTDRVDEVVSDILQTYAAIPASIIPTADWSAEAVQWLSNYDLQNVLSEPKPVSEVISQISRETGVDIWYDIEDNEIKFKSNTPQVGTLMRIDDESLVDAKASIKVKEKDRLSRVLFYYNPRDLIDDLDKPKNFANLNLKIDIDAESDDEYGQIQQDETFCQWLKSDALVSQQATRKANRYNAPPVEFAAQLPMNYESIKTGDHIRLNSDLYQQPDGSNKEVLLQVLSAGPNVKDNYHEVKGLTFFSGVGRSAFICPIGTGDYTTATGDANPSYSWICTTSTAQMPNGDDPYLII